MRRADRLFQIIQNLHHERVVTARYLAQELEVSERTIYRDIQDLSLSGVPITGEAGNGYRLMRGYQLQPLMFNEEELSALMIGVRMVQAWTDQSLAKSAHSAMQKIEHAIPERLKPELERTEIFVPKYAASEKESNQLLLIRTAIRKHNKIFFNYTRQDGTASARKVWPLGLFYWGKIWTLVAWCELRDGFRHFRLDRMEKLVMQDEEYELLPGKTLDDFLEQKWS